LIASIDVVVERLDATAESGSDSETN